MNHSITTAVLMLLPFLSIAQVTSYTPLDEMATDIRQPILADLNGDGRNDIVAPLTDNTRWYENLGAGNFSEGTNLDFASHNIAAADIDNDGDQDLIGRTRSEIFLLVNDGQGEFAQQNIIIEGSFRTTPLFAPLLFDDIDGDGSIDLVTLINNYPIWFRNDGGTFNSVGDTLVQDKVTDMHLVDVNGDQLNELIYSNYDRDFLDGIRLWMHDRSVDGFGPQVQVSTRTFAVGLSTTTGDIDGDGDQDVVGFDEGSPIFLFENVNGTLQPEVTIEGTDLDIDNFSYTSVQLLDLDQNGTDDLLAKLFQNTGDEDIVFFTSSSGSRSIVETFSGLTSPWDLLIDDLDEDGVQDLIVSSFSDAFLGWTSAPANTTSIFSERFEAMSIWPNPVYDKINLDGINNKESIIRLIRLDGHTTTLIQTSAVNDISVGDLLPGIYLIIIESAEQRRAAKFIKQ